LQSILAIDDGVAGIAAALGTERWNRACVAVISDNGYLLGEHDLTGKGFPYDKSVRVPMLLRCPGIPAGTDERLIASIDLAPTLALVARTSLSFPADGRPVQHAWVRERVLLESWSPNEELHIIPFTAVRTLHETYVEYTDRTTLLWDRRVDGEETDQLTPENAPVWAAHLAALRECAGATCRAAEDAS
jgi:arylsulfatase A-like enzyme